MFAESLHIFVSHWSQLDEDLSFEGMFQTDDVFYENHD